VGSIPVERGAGRSVAAVQFVSSTFEDLKAELAKLCAENGVGFQAI